MDPYNLPPELSRQKRRRKKENKCYTICLIDKHRSRKASGKQFAAYFENEVADREFWLFSSNLRFILLRNL